MARLVVDGVRMQNRRLLPQEQRRPVSDPRGADAHSMRGQPLTFEIPVLRLDRSFVGASVRRASDLSGISTMELDLLAHQFPKWKEAITVTTPAGIVFRGEAAIFFLKNNNAWGQPSEEPPVGSNKDELMGETLKKIDEWVLAPYQRKVELPLMFRVSGKDGASFSVSEKLQENFVLALLPTLSRQGLSRELQSPFSPSPEIVKDFFEKLKELTKREFRLPRNEELEASLLSRAREKEKSLFVSKRPQVFYEWVEDKKERPYVAKIIIVENGIEPIVTENREVQQNGETYFRIVLSPLPEAPRRRSLY